MLPQSQLPYIVIVAALGGLLLIGALVSIAYLAGASPLDTQFVFRRNPDARSRERKVAVDLTLRHVLGFGLLASGPLLACGAIFFVTVWRPRYWYWWLLGAVLLAVALIWLADVVGPPVAREKPAGGLLKPHRCGVREIVGGLMGVAALLAAASNVGALVITGSPLFPPHPLNPLFPLALILFFSAASRLIRGPR